MKKNSEYKTNFPHKIQWKYPEAIVDCNWLKDKINKEEIRIYDCTTYLHYTDENPSKPYDVCSGNEEYKKGHIPGSAYLDLQNQLSEPNSSYSFTLPKLEKLADCFKKCGIGKPFHIILYSRNGIQWATRVWWMLYILGYKKVSILNGGFTEWLRLDFPVDRNSTYFASSDFSVDKNKDIFVHKEQVLKAINDKSCILVNALTEDIHSGQSSRYGRPGRIPNSLNIPFHRFLDLESGKFIKPSEALKIFKEKRISPDKNIINYCGGGIAATLDCFILYQLGYPNLFIYDNSMREWAMNPSLPMETD